MQDYHIYAHYVKDNGVSPTSPRYTKKESPTVATTAPTKEHHESRSKLIPTSAKLISTGLAIAHKVNSYVGELTENRIAARRTQVGLTVAGLVYLTATNPITGGIAAAMYFGNAGVQYGIKVYKENLSADYMRQLSGGTVRTGR